MMNRALWTGVLAVLWASVAAAEPVVRVDCSRGEGINRALSRSPHEESLVVEIRGMCEENVVVARDRVTLRGSDPASDGIRALRGGDTLDAALTVKAELVTVENLTLTGGSSGLLASGVTLPFLTVRNSRLQGNASYGALLEGSSLVQFEDSSFSSNRTNAGAFDTSNFRCLRCTLSGDPASSGPNVLAFGDAYLLIAESQLTNGGVAAGGLTLIVDSSIAATPAGAALTAATPSRGSITRVQLTGPVTLREGANLRLFGVTQVLAAGSNLVEDGSFLRVGDASPAAGGPPSIASSLAGFSLRSFSNLSLTQTSRIDGSLSCSLGANAACVNPSRVSGTSNCAACPKP
jgi:hypothetical protein